MIDPGGAGRLIGRTISHYRVIATLGVGGMGVVYRAEDVRLGRPVAIKFVADDFANDAQAVARLRAEARAASALNHPNICTIHDIGTEEGHPFIVMELMEGQTLRDRLGRGHLKVHELVDLGIQAADALQAAHSAGIIHRDIKPANIFLTGRTHVKLLDFGLAKLSAGHPGPDTATTLATAELTVAGTTLGTVTYMSPEQAAGEELDGRTDLFSLGVVLYECATGRQPFEGKTHALILSAILNRAPVAPSALNHELPPRLQDIILTCLEKDRELRYQSAADLRADLKRVRRDLESGHLVTGATEALVAGPVSETAARGSGPSAVQAAGSAPSAPAANQAHSRVPLVAGGLLALVVGVAGGLALWNRSHQAAPEAPALPSTTSADATAVPDNIIQSQLALARSSFAAGNYRAAQSYASEVLAAQPNQAEALNIRREAAAALDRFAQAVTLARQRLASNDVQGAARAVAEAREIDPTSPIVNELASALTQRVREPAPPPAARGGRPAADDPGHAPGRAPAASPTRPTETVAAPPVPSPPPPPDPSPAAPVAPPATAAPSAGTATAPPPDNAASADRPAAARAAQPVASTPPPVDRAPTPPQPASPETDEAAVRRVVASYARAIESKDVALFRSVKPNLSGEEERRLQEGFRAVASQQVRLTPTSVEVRGQDATVIAARRDIIDAGGRRQTVESRQTFRLTRTTSGWVISEIR